MFISLLLTEYQYYNILSAFITVHAITWYC